MGRITRKYTRKITSITCSNSDKARGGMLAAVAAVLAYRYATLANPEIAPVDYCDMLGQDDIQGKKTWFLRETRCTMLVAKLWSSTFRRTKPLV